MARALGLANHPEAISVDSSNNVTVEGNFDVNGTQTIIDSTTVAVTDSLFKLAKDNTTADTLDAGWYGVYNDGSTRYAGIARDATDGKFIVYDGLTEEPGTTIDTGHASFNKATLSVGAVEDAIGDVRTPRWTQITTATTIADEGVYYCQNAPTLTLGAPAAGAVMTIYNDNASSMTLNRGSTLNNMRIAADNDITNNTSLTLGARSTTTVTMFTPYLGVVTGTDVT